MKLIENRTTKKNLKNITFRVDSELIEEFRTLTKELSVKQTMIITNAMKKAIEEMKELKGETND